MKQPMYCFKDTKSGYKIPFADINNALAIRHTQNALKEKNEFSLNPEDFELWCVGSFDTETGIFDPDLVHIANCVDLMPTE